MSIDKSEQELGQQLLDALDKAIKEGPWDEGLLFQTTGKKLRRLREEVAEELGMSAIDAAKEITGRKHQAGDLEVYISLYNTDGDSIDKWQKILINCGPNIITRPVYRNESDVRSSLREKLNSINDAYVVVNLNESDIIKSNDPALVLKDRSGRELLNIKDGAIKPENISRFAHKSGEYDFKNSKLIKQNNN